MGRLDAVFLSAGVPDRSAKHFLGEGDSVAIKAAVSALLHVTLGRRRLVWGGHPAITPMVWAFAAAMEVDYGAWVHLYQSVFFEDHFPAQTKAFGNVTFTERREDEASSLSHMRRRMFRETSFEAAVFVGGMAGVLEEYGMLRDGTRPPRMLPIASTGGAAGVLAVQARGAEFADELDYVDLFHRELAIDWNEERYRRPEDQPEAVADRIVAPTREGRP